MNFESLGEKLRYYRKEYGLTQEQLALKVGITQKYVSNIEHAKSVPTLQTLMKICNALKITPNTLLKDSLVFQNPELTGEIVSILTKCTYDQLLEVEDYVHHILGRKMTSPD